MKKIVLSAMIASAVLSATDYNYELSPMVGYAFPNNAQDLKNHAVYGAEMLFNDCGTALKPELSVLYSNADYKPASGDTNIFRSALNGVYELKKGNDITPFVKAGIGYETMSNHQYDNHNSAFADVGAGVKVALTEQIGLKLEAIEMLKFNDFQWDNNLLVMAGLNFGFGAKAQPAAPVAAAAVVAAPVVAAVVAPKPAPVVAAPVAVAPAAPIDSDKDGVFDDKDKCPNTPAGFKVDKDGCPTKLTLHLHFKTDSTAVDATGTSEVNAFASFLNESPAYKATIVGHTDSTASDVYNQKLSEKRAATVKSMLIGQGVDANRLTAMGEGEKMPVATNKTKEGRAENRRIEVELCK